MSEKSVETSKTTKKGEKIFKKVNAEIVKMEPGDTFEGTFKGRTEGPWVDKTTGEEKSLVRLHFTREDGTKAILFEDGGLRNSLANAMVKEGDFIRLVKGEKSSLGGGRTVNQWDVYSAEQ